ncbi:tRNA (adenosine(37)-N6)-threonylcarbamoyltransferase complex transferase subunit TsaD [Macrococcoides caseolyticum]|uniref:tRNA (Adenosine(37)-N6)-threonylcarbamoyltransferase complex transferase subunit TsaD n=1 Tax=Macrococcoides caseolyticum TaxID=69966 RepID=A0ACC9MPX6_9STAP|nr:tRNA (adenosine(37)-N6)-threonylcarbamoyltransferase complex transferase subunit TsaD [Macrococcus caseolyticus]MDJ1110235.1 tRNA (adenosine(37)-N6)-threonylcarbamoyltransferase complex transferase subunit TsaD [Macrococcus caseolyticus]PKE33326.1 tRNA (adenosine(37)-N6)-threonylcarbamoyltransferase complex transferase subunit TsaD [Macrococcus caseolyticus]PKE38486.1 tRNA (adenosine(37)-N6)-threonylcarbamoyltransferase complex transferase subunit TsaD [Macrococcus caseolyticus]PKE44556.1 tR
MNNEKDITILAIETSCDETAASVVRNGYEVLSNIVNSQIESHKRFGGVVPEVASRHHVENITMVIEETLVEAHMTWEDIDAVAVTEGPGLIGALLVGINAAKALALAHSKPLIPVHHIAGHVYANHIEERLTFPMLALVISGGHTELVLMKDHMAFEVIGETRDDAVGEAYDKVARTIDLPYPGGPHVDRLAASGEDVLEFPRPIMDDYDFSFSGLKSAVINKLHNLNQKGISYNKEDVAASFQASVIDVLTTQTFKALEDYDIKQLLICGGVAANRGIRARMEMMCDSNDVKLLIPPLNLCTDNAAMIGAAAYYQYIAGKFGTMDLNGRSNIDL